MFWRCDNCNATYSDEDTDRGHKIGDIKPLFVEYLGETKTICYRCANAIAGRKWGFDFKDGNPYASYPEAEEQIKTMIRDRKFSHILWDILDREGMLTEGPYGLELVWNGEGLPPASRPEYIRALDEAEEVMREYERTGVLPQDWLRKMWDGRKGK